MKWRIKVWCDAGLRIWGALSVYASSCCYANADPFLPRFEISLNFLAADGDLRFRPRLGAIRLDSLTTLDLWLEHETEVCSYGRIQSSLILRPLVTGVFYRSPDVFIWLAPSGDRRMLSDWKTVDLPEDFAAVRTLVPDSRKFRLYETYNARVLTDGGQAWHFVSDDGWLLYYSGGSLSWFRTPSGSCFDVTSAGKAILCIRSENGRRILEAAWPSPRAPATVRSSGFALAFECARPGMIAAVSNEEGAVLAEFGYSEEHLLATASLVGEPLLVFRWRGNHRYSHGDSPYSKPYSLASVNGTDYEFDISRSVFSLRAVSATGRRIIRFRANERGVYWLTEKRRGSLE